MRLRLRFLRVELALAGVEVVEVVVVEVEMEVGVAERSDLDRMLRGACTEEAVVEEENGPAASCIFGSPAEGGDFGRGISSITVTTGVGELDRNSSSASSYIDIPDSLPPSVSSQVGGGRWEVDGYKDDNGVISTPAKEPPTGVVVKADDDDSGCCGHSSGKVPGKPCCDSVGGLAWISTAWSDSGLGSGLGSGALISGTGLRFPTVPSVT